MLLGRPFLLLPALSAQPGERSEGSNPFLDAFQWIGQILVWPVVVVLLLVAAWFVVSRLRRRP